MHILTRRFVYQYTMALLLFLTIDSLWIYFVAKNLYQDSVESILAVNPQWLPALIFYVLYSFGLWFFAIRSSGKANNAAIRGAILGLTAYGTYALTGQALFQGWEWSLTLADCAWGALISATVAYITVKLFPA